MSDAGLPELLRRRLDLVARVSETTSQLQRWQQARRSTDLDALRCEMFDGDAVQSRQTKGLQTTNLRDELEDAIRRAVEADAGIARCEGQLAAIGESLAEADREIKALAGR